MSITERPGPRPKRVRVVATMLAVALLGGGWAAGVAFQSPRQREAAARPPEPTNVTEAVTSGRLADEVFVRATVGHRLDERVMPRVLPEHPTVTSVHIAIGEVIAAGSAPLALNGRPVLVMPGSFPFYRDFLPGLTGPDVSQIQTGLTLAGLLASGREPGVFGPATQRAVRSLYETAGFDTAFTTIPSPDPAAPPTMAVMLPLSEVAVVQELPATVTFVAAVGEVSGEQPELVTLAGGPLVARAIVPPSVASRLDAGMPIELSTDGGEVVAARLESVAPAAGAADPDGLTVTMAEAETPLPGSWAGLNVLARITVEEVAGEALIVPSRAVVTGPDGLSFVSKAGPHGGSARVPVRELGALAGRSAVEAGATGTLAVGDRVLVE